MIEKGIILYESSSLLHVRTQQGSAFTFSRLPQPQSGLVPRSGVYWFLRGIAGVGREEGRHHDGQNPKTPKPQNPVEKLLLHLTRVMNI